VDACALSLASLTDRAFAMFFREALDFLRVFDFPPLDPKSAAIVEIAASAFLMFIGWTLL
jgi:hypothetical protein